MLSPFKLIQVESSIWWWGRARIRVGIQEEEKTGHCSETSQYGLFCSTKPKTDCLKGVGFRSALGLASLRSSLLSSQKLMNQKNSHPPQRAEGGLFSRKTWQVLEPMTGPHLPRCHTDEQPLPHPLQATHLLLKTVTKHLVTFGFFSHHRENVGTVKYAHFLFWASGAEHRRSSKDCLLGRNPPSQRHINVSAPLLVSSYKNLASHTQASACVST